MAVDGRQAALDNALKQIEKDFGKGAIMRLGEAADRMNVEVISSGSLAIDIAVGVGGFPRGRVIEIYGPESSGKTNSRSSRCSRSSKTRWYCSIY